MPKSVCRAGRRGLDEAVASYRRALELKPDYSAGHSNLLVTLPYRQSVTPEELAETLARDLDEYVELAVNLANDLPRLARLRAGLRNRVARSPLCDGRRFAENLLVLLRSV